MPILRTLRALGRDTLAAVLTAPVEVALGLFLALAFSHELRRGGNAPEVFLQVAGTVTIAFPLVFGLTVLRVRGLLAPAARWAATAAVLALAGAYGAYRLDTLSAAEGWRWVMLAGSGVLLLPLAAALPAGPGARRRLWGFGAGVVLRVAAVALYSAALFALLAGAVAAVASLFDLRTPANLYGDIAGAIFFALAPTLLVGGVHRLVAPPPEGVPALAGALGRWLYAPALGVYLAILYAYAVRVLVTGELPRNLLSPLVLAAGAIGLLGAFLLEPVHESEDHRGLSLLTRAVPPLLLPLIPLAAWGLAVRVDAYGWTEPRYLRAALVAALGVLAVLGTVRVIRRGPPLLASIPLVLAATLLLSAVGPWSASAVTVRDQSARLRAALAEAGIDPASLPREPVTVDSALMARIESPARYLRWAHGDAVLRRVVPGLPDSLPPHGPVSRSIGIRQECTLAATTDLNLDWAEGVEVEAGVLAEVTVSEREERTVRVDGMDLTLTLAAGAVTARTEAWVARAPLDTLSARAASAVEASCDRARYRSARELAPDAALLVLRDGEGVLRARFLVTSARVDHEVRSLAGFLILPRR